METAAAEATAPTTKAAAGVGRPDPEPHNRHRDEPAEGQGCDAAPEGTPGHHVSPSAHSWLPASSLKAIFSAPGSRSAVKRAGAICGAKSQSLKTALNCGLPGRVR